MAEREAEESMKLTFLPMLAVEAIRRKYWGKARTATSMKLETLIDKRDKNLHFLTSASKFLPNLAANRMAPIGPKTSLRTHWKAAAATVAYAYEPPIDTNKH